MQYLNDYERLLEVSGGIGTCECLLENELGTLMLGDCFSIIQCSRKCCLENRGVFYKYKTVGGGPKSKGMCEYGM